MSSDKRKSKQRTSAPYYARKLKKIMSFFLKEGHQGKICLEGDESKEKGKKGALRVNITKVDNDSDFSLVTSSVCSTTQNESILDFMSSYHCCLNREWFSIYTPLETSVVLLGNDYDYHTEGVGNIRVKLHDGMVRKLVNVMHAPILKKNLIFLNVLENNV